MGNWNSGARPKPHALKVLRGKEKAGTSTEPIMPAVGADFDTPPSELADDPIASAEWRRVAPMLRVSGIVTEGDRALLLSCCHTWSVYQDAQRMLRKTGMLQKGKFGPTISPYFGIADRALTQCRHLWASLGLTPTGRASLTAAKVPARTPPNKWDGLLE